MTGRQCEKRELLDTMNRNESQFVAVYGRRRVGKTYLVRETFQNRFCFAHSGVANVGTHEQILHFRDSLVRYGYENCPSLRNWREAFLALETLIEQCDGEKKVIFLDELPWMDTRQSHFVSSLEHFWNGFASARKDIVLIACSSATSWMADNLLKNKGGLHNRVTDRIHLRPFCLGECEEYCNELGLRFSREEICQGYMVFGGIPFYWSLMRRDLSLRQNVDYLVFSEDGKLRGEFDELLSSLFRNSNLYRRIITALSSTGSGMVREDILSKLRIADGGGVSKCLENLEACGFVRRYMPFGKKKKESLIQLVDNFSLFHLRFLEEDPNPDENFWTNTSSSAMQSAWGGIAFERVCLAHLRQLKDALRIGGVLTHVCSWRHVPDETVSKGAQIDLLIDRADGVIDVCEMKYSTDIFVPTEKSDSDMRRRMAIFQEVSKTRKAVNAVLVTPYGLEPNRYSGRFSNVITFKELFATAE